jgi:hypothetical protein
MKAEERAKRAYQAARAKPSGNGHAKPPAKKRAPPVAYEIPEADRGDAFEPADGAGASSASSISTDDGWEPLIPLTGGGEAPPFPLYVLPADLSRLVECGAAALPCPPDYIACTLLGLAGAAIGASRSLCVKDGYYVRPNMYLGVIGPPGARKSPALALLAAPFYQRQSELHDADELALADWTASGSTDKTKRPRPKAVYIDDATVESIAALLQDNPRGLVSIQDELSAWIANLNAYKVNGKGADFEFFLKAWTGATHSVHRRNPDARPIFLRYPCLSVVGMVTPKKVRETFAVGDESTGFLERILLSYPAAVPARGETWQCVPPDVTDAWEFTLRDLWNLEGEQTDHGPRPHAVNLTSCGRRAWERFTGELADAQNASGFPVHLRAFWSKHESYGARIALVLHLLRHAAAPGRHADVDGRAVDEAAVVIKYFQAHLLKLLGTLGSDPDTERAQRVVDWIVKERRTAFKRHEAKRDVRSDGLIDTLADMDRAINRLIRHNHLRVAIPEPTKGRGRPPSDLYECHPDLLK